MYYRLLCILKNRSQPSRRSSSSQSTPRHSHFSSRQSQSTPIHKSSSGKHASSSESSKSATKYSSPHKSPSPVTCFYCKEPNHVRKRPRHSLAQTTSPSTFQTTSPSTPPAVPSPSVHRVRQRDYLDSFHSSNIMQQNEEKDDDVTDPVHLLLQPVLHRTAEYFLSPLVLILLRLYLLISSPHLHRLLDAPFFCHEHHFDTAFGLDLSS
ncbi:hypothetical protein P9112_009983 [Eukaryota sp. TZLM1-RC]